MPDETLDPHIELARAASEAKALITSAAADAKAVINQAAASAISTLTTAAAVQSKDIEYLRASMGRVEAKIDALDSKYVSQTVFSLLEKRVEELAQEQEKCGKGCVTSSDFEFWRNSLAAAFGGLLVILSGVIVSKWFH